MLVLNLVQIALFVQMLLSETNM